MNILDFVKKINNTLPTTDNIINSFSKEIDINYAKEFLERNQLKIESDYTLEDSIECLINATNINFISIGSIDFSNKITLTENKKVFATYQEIFPVYQDTRNNAFYCDYDDKKIFAANNLSEFLTNCVFYSEIDNKKLFSEISSEFQNKIDLFIKNTDVDSFFTMLIKELL